MTRIPPIEEADHPQLAELVERIRRGRRDTFADVYRMLLHAPRLAEPWLDLFSALRWRTQLSGRLREIVIIRVAYLGEASYILAQHVPALARKEGLSQEECDALVDWEATDLFGESERAALRYVDAMTRGPGVADGTFEGLRDHFDERQLVELTVLIGAYIMHTRVLAALQIDTPANT